MVVPNDPADNRHLRRKLAVAKDEFPTNERGFDADEVVKARPHTAEVVGQIAYLEIVVFNQEILRGKGHGCVICYHWLIKHVDANDAPTLRNVLGQFDQVPPRIGKEGETAVDLNNIERFFHDRDP